MAEYRSIEDSRHVSYKYFPLKEKVKLYFETDSKTVYLTGYVQENQPGIFSKAEETNIVVECADPWFYETSDATTVFSGVESMFEFPFDNNSLTQKLIVFGEIQNSLVKTFYYRGDVPVGFEAEINVLLPIDSPYRVDRIRIMNLDTREVLEIDTEALKRISGGPLKFADLILVSTVPGDKYAYLIRNGDEIDIMNAITKNSDWPKIYAGENTFAYAAERGIEFLEFQIHYKIAYTGL